MAHATVTSCASAHAVSLVTTPDHRSAVVKQWHAGVATGRHLRQELFVYRLSRSVPALAAVLPRAWHLDEGHQVLVLEAIGNGHAAVPRLDAPGAADALGRSMAGVHAATTDTGLWPSPCMGILEMPDAIEMAMAGRSAATCRLMRLIVDDAALAAVLRSARRGWRDRCLIHGDLRRENWFAVEDASAPRACVIDWELSGSGDPAWDLAAVIVETALDGLRDVAGGRGPSSSAVPAFLRAYLHAGGLLDAHDDDAWRHLWACAVARLLHVATEWTERQPGDDVTVVEPLLAQARDWTHAQADLVEESRTWGAG